MSLAAEVGRLERRVNMIRWDNREGFAASVPLDLHSRDIDGGGAPELHPAFVAYLRDAGVCFCEATWPDGKPREHSCDRRFTKAPAKVRGSNHRQHPRRLKRAFRQLRLIAPLEFNAVYLILARGRSWWQAMEEINASRLARGEDQFTQQEFAILTIAGFDKLVECW